MASSLATRQRTALAGPPTISGKPYRILIADDHAIVRRGLRSLLDSQPGIEVCSEAANGAETLELVRKLKPDLVVLDLTMPEMNGLDVTRAIRETSPASAILILTMHFSEELAREVLRAGARGYVLKSDADSDLLAAVDHVRHNQPFFTGALTTSMAHTFVHGPDENETTSAEKHLSSSPLTNREVEVVQLLGEGKSNKEAAVELGVSTRTIESHRNHIMRKMNFRSFSDLVRFAVRNNLVDL